MIKYLRLIKICRKHSDMDGLSIMDIKKKFSKLCSSNTSSSIIVYRTKATKNCTLPRND